MNINELFPYPIDIGCLYAIVIQNGDTKRISELLKLRSIESFNWEVGRKKFWRHNNFDKIGHSESVIVSEEIEGWNYILCDRFYDLKYALNSCNVLSKEYSEMYHFVYDGHTGQSRFIYIKNGSIVRFFERDSDSNTGEFGEELEIEQKIIAESKDEYYDHVWNLAKEVLNENVWSEQSFERNIIVGRRYSMEIEKYKNIFREPLPPEK